MLMRIKELYEKINRGEITSEIDIQRDIVYDFKKQELVVDSVMNDIPLPAFYFWDNEDMDENERGKYEVLDGRQRLEAIKNFLQNDIRYQGKQFKEIDPTLQDKFNNTELSIIICTGDEAHKRKIFERINTLGVALNDFEVLNGLFNGEYIRGVREYADKDKWARKIFGSNTRGKASYRILNKLKEAKQYDGVAVKDLKDYIQANQDKPFEDDQKYIAKYFKFVCEIFDKPDKNFDILFRLALKYHANKVLWKQHKDEINERISQYVRSDEFKLYPKEREAIIEEFCLAAVDGVKVDPRRFFTKEQKQQLLDMQPKDTIIDGKYMCAGCGQHYYPDELQVDHQLAWSKGGRTELSNAQLLCSTCNPRKGNK